MQSKLFLLYATLTVAMAAAESPKPNPTDSEPCHYSPTTCHLHGSSEQAAIKVYRCANETNTLICMSSSAITWVSGWNSEKIPIIPPSQLRINSTNNSHQFCLSLTLTQGPLSWNTSVYAACRDNKGIGNKVWFEIAKGFSLQDPEFKPKGRIFLADLIVDSKEFTTFDSIPVKTFDLAIMAAVTCVIFLLVLAAILVRKVLKKKGKTSSEITEEEIEEFMQGVPEEKLKSSGIIAPFFLPYDTGLEVPKSDVAFHSAKLRSGVFGQVVKGTFRGVEVAIKMLKNNTADNNADYLRSLLAELKVMSYLGQHPNLVRLIGAITENVKGGEVYLLLEYCSNGNVHSFLRHNSHIFVDLLAGQVSPNPGDTQRISRSSTSYGAIPAPSVSLTTKVLVRWASEVALAMEYVAEHHVYHGELSARNIVLTEGLTAKITDFGLPKQLDMESYTRSIKNKQSHLPLKWMAIESLRDLTFSIQSDVWSFGVTLWEFFTLGATPYPGIKWNLDSWKLLREGKRLDKPEHASYSLYEIMLKCWETDPDARPEFKELAQLLNKEFLKF